MKVSDLEGPLLDAWVARCEGYKHVGVVDGQVCVSSDYPLDQLRPRRSHAFSSDWAQGGPILDAHPITIERGDFLPHGPCKAWIRVNGAFSFAYGDTPLIAAMRSYVASNFGEEVPDDESVKR